MRVNKEYQKTPALFADKTAVAQRLDMVRDDSSGTALLGMSIAALGVATIGVIWHEGDKMYVWQQVAATAVFGLATAGISITMARAWAADLYERHLLKRILRNFDSKE